jgi:hypothetical protein
LNVWLYLQGAKPFFEPALFHDQRAGITVIALVIIPVTHAISHLIARRHAVQFGNHWTTRLPLVFVDELVEGSRDAKIYQGSVMALAIVLPFLALAHVGLEFSDLANPLHCRIGDKFQEAGIWAWPSEAKIDGDCRVGYRPPTEGGVTFIPVVEPLIIILLVIVDIFLAGRLCKVLFGPATLNGGSNQ